MSTEAPAIPVSPKTLGTLFEFTYAVFRRNTEGITHEESLKAPSPGGNCINWVGGHIVSVRLGMLEMLGVPPLWSPEHRERYRRGSAPLTNEAEALPWERILADLDTSQERLRSALAALTPERLVAPLPADRNPFGVDSFGDQLGLFHFHEAYHVGQLGVLRRLAGKPGAIA